MKEGDGDGKDEEEDEPNEKMQKFFNDENTIYNMLNKICDSKEGFKDNKLQMYKIDFFKELLAVIKFLIFN